VTTIESSRANEEPQHTCLEMSGESIYKAGMELLP
jgi:hypothetical protein